MASPDMKPHPCVAAKGGAAAATMHACSEVSLVLLVLLLLLCFPSCAGD